MTAYEISLEFHAGLAGNVSRIRVRSPFWEKSEYVTISHDCMSYSELEEQVSSIKGKLDEVLKQGRRKYSKVRE